MDREWRAVRMNWRQWTGLWKAKGQKLEGMEEALKGREGYSRSSLSKLGKSTEEADPELVAFLWALETRPKAELDFELYWRGLASLGIEVPAPLLEKLGTTPPPRVDLRELAAGLAPKLDAIVSTLEGKLDAVLSALGGKLDSAASTVRGKLDAFALAARSKLQDVDDKLDRTDAKLGSIEAGQYKAELKLDKVSAQLDRLALAVLGAGAFIGLGCVALAVVVFQRGPAAVPPVAPVAVSVTAMPGSKLLVVGGLVERGQLPAGPYIPFSLETGVDGSLGEHKFRPMPHQKLPHQAGAPCHGSQTTLYGACWRGTDSAPPCPLDTFQEGAKCYIPVMALPETPLSSPP